MKALRVLVAAATVADAQAAAAPLRAEFADIAFSTVPQRFVADFDEHRAPLCVIAFGHLDQADQYLAGLDRASESLHAFAHRRLVLCTRDESARARSLCQQGRFDDYVPFWPEPADPQRLPMAAHRAACELLELAARGARQRAWVEEARGLEGVQTQLAASANWVLERVDAAKRELELALAGAADRASDLERRFDAVKTTLDWMRHWALRLDDEWHAELAAVQRLRRLAGRARPVILVVDDDEFQHQLLRRMLGDLDLELLFTSSLGDAMAILQVRRPDCILMDVGLPDVDGVDAVRMIKSVRAGDAIRIVMLTGSNDEPTLQRSLDAGAAGLIGKPFNRSALLSQLRAVWPAEAWMAAARD